jgi:hypothetical protein
MIAASILNNGAIAAKRQIEPCGLSNRHASWFRGTAPGSVAVQRTTIGPSTKFEAVASASAQSSRLQSSESVMRIPLLLTRIS